MPGNASAAHVLPAHFLAKSQGCHSLIVRSVENLRRCRSREETVMRATLFVEIAMLSFRASRPAKPHENLELRSQRPGAVRSRTH